jgi:hypothetical protein
MKITFEAHPIETAPSGRPIMVYIPKYREWQQGRWYGNHARTFLGVIKTPRTGRRSRT